MGVGGSKARGKGVSGRGRRLAKPPAASDNGRGNSRGQEASSVLRFTIPSDLAAGHDLQKRIVNEVSRLGYNDQCKFAINLALEEGLINAIRHGNRLDPRKKVRVDAKISAKRLRVVIEDEGTGFDPHGVPDPRLDENLEKPTGRGMLLIRAYMNSVRWSRGGRRITMIKNNEPDVLPRA